MAEVNGISKHEDPVSVSASLLGKRKRTGSPEIASKDSALQSALQEALRVLRKYDTTPSLLKYPLPSSKPEAPEVKRARLVKSESASDNIEDRILTGTYTSFHALRDDVQSAQNALITDLSSTTQNGEVESDVQGQLSKLVNVLDKYETESSEVFQTNGEDLPKADLISPSPKQFLSLRSQVNGSVQILFSGLQVQRQPEKDKAGGTPEGESSRLPNGFELTDFSALGGDQETFKKQEKRLFGTVFRQAGRIKPLDLPHTARDVVRGNTLEFIPNSSRTENLPQNKHDYKFARLATSSWLSYSTTSNHPQQEDRRRVQPASSNNDFKAALEANSVRQGHDLSPEELFGSVYSSFAPTSDNSYSLVSEKDKSRQWWRQYGEQKLSRLFQTREPAVSLVDGESGEAEERDEFAELVADFEPEQDGESAQQPESTEKEIETLLEEVSEMIETLSSYQRNRSLETIVAGTVPKPTTSEMDTFTMLRDQLNILVSSLPPFAVAKLNGDQLEELNISTRLVVEVPDYPGTGHMDEYMKFRQKIVQQAAAAASRASGTPQQVRPNYSQAQGTPMAYNSQVRNYNASVPTTAAYGVRTQNYQTPTIARPTYPQNSYQASANPYSSSRPTIQQFQRPSMQNGYGSYGSNASAPAQTQPQTPGAYRPTQPGYPQRAQDNAATLARSASPQKPLVNGALGQSHQYARQYQTQQTQPPQTPYAYQQRQGSGTPSTPIAAAAVAGAAGGGYGGRYDGAAGDSSSQTIDISR